jgi:hypothetical protein
MQSVFTCMQLVTRFLYADKEYNYRFLRNDAGV